MTEGGTMSDEQWDWDILISGKGSKVEVTGKLLREEVPAILYRLAAQYAEEHGTSVEESLRGQAERFLRERNEARARLARIAEAHEKNVGTGGMTNGLCIECGERDPCPTHVWATTERHPFNTWDPDDDEGVDAADE
jgi:hypothetical protein